MQLFYFIFVMKNYKQNMRNTIFAMCLSVCVLALTGCFSAASSSLSGRGGEVVGVGGRNFTEPTFTAW